MNAKNIRSSMNGTYWERASVRTHDEVEKNWCFRTNWHRSQRRCHPHSISRWCYSFFCLFLASFFSVHLFHLFYIVYEFYFCSPSHYPFLFPIRLTRYTISRWCWSLLLPFFVQTNSTFPENEMCALEFWHGMSHRATLSIVFRTEITHNFCPNTIVAKYEIMLT